MARLVAMVKMRMCRPLLLNPEHVFGMPVFLHRSCPSRLQRSGLTLIEILAVLLIVGMIGGVLLSALQQRIDDNDGARRQWQAFLQFDQELRQAARRAAPITVTHHGLRLRAQGTGLKRELTCAPGVRFHDADKKVLRSWMYDRHGSSIDITFVSAALRRTLAGLSGLPTQDIIQNPGNGHSPDTGQAQRDE